MPVTRSAQSLAPKQSLDRPRVHRSDEERYQMLKREAFIDPNRIQPDGVWCICCCAEIQLDSRAVGHYYPSAWNKHEKTGKHKANSRRWKEEERNMSGSYAGSPPQRGKSTRIDRRKKVPAEEQHIMQVGDAQATTPVQPDYSGMILPLQIPDPKLPTNAVLPYKLDRKRLRQTCCKDRWPEYCRSHAIDAWGARPRVWSANLL